MPWSLGLAVVGGATGALLIAHLGRRLVPRVVGMVARQQIAPPPPTATFKPIELLQQAQIKEKMPPFVSLATVEGGNAAVRTMVCRGVIESGSSGVGLWFAVDGRTPKARSERAAVVWYFQRTRQQFRFVGSLQPLRDVEMMWSMLSPATKAQYAGRPSGTPYVEADVLGVMKSVGGGMISPNFVPVVLNVESIDHLQLPMDDGSLGDGREATATVWALRWVYRFQDGKWLEERVNP